MARRLIDILARLVATPRRRIATLLLAGLALVLFFILFLPTLLNTSTVQNRLKTVLSDVVKGPVAWSRMELSWAHGLYLADLSVGPADGALRTARIKELVCDPGFGFGAKPGESFGIDLFLRLHAVEIELVPPPGAPVPPPTASPAPPIDPLTALAQGLERFATLSWPLPIDLRLDIAIDPLTLAYRDPASNRSIRFDQGALQLKIPSLERAPIVFDLGGELRADDHALGPLRINAEICGLVATSGRIVPAAAVVALRADLPGVAAQADGRIDQGGGLKAQLRLDLPRLRALAASLVPQTLPQLGGTIEVMLLTQADAERNLHLRCTVQGKELVASGAPLPAGRVGPLAFVLEQQIDTDQSRQSVSFAPGRLTVPELLDARWQATVEKPTAPQRTVAARLELLSVDLDQALLLAAPFLPPGLPQLHGGRLEVRDFAVHLRGTTGAGEVALQRGALTLVELRLPLAAGALAVSGVSLAAHDLKVPLAAFFPTAVQSGLTWQLDQLQLSGPQPVSLRALGGEGEVEIRDLARAPLGLAKVACSGKVHHQLRCAATELPALLLLREIRNELSFAFRLPVGGGAVLDSLSCDTRIAAVGAAVSGKQLSSFPLMQTLRIAGVSLPADGALPTLGSARLQVSSPQLCEVSAALALDRQRLLTLAMGSHVELRRLTTLAAPLLPAQLALGGTLAGELRASLILPQGALPGGQPPLRSARTALALVQELDGSLRLDQVELRLPVAGGIVQVSALTTPQPLRLHSTSRDERIALSGALDFALPEGLALSGATLPPQQGGVVFSGELVEWNRLFLGESFRLHPLGLTEHGEVTVGRLASLLDAPLPPSPATLLQRLDATLFGEVELHLPASAPPLLTGLTMTGQASAGVRVDLTGGRALRLHTYADSRELGIKLASGLHADAVTAHLSLDRDFRIVTPTSPQERPAFLSESLVQPLPPPLAPPSEETLQRLHDDLRGNSGAQRALTVAEVEAPVLGSSLLLRAIEGEFATGTEQLGLNFLQTELLGGALRARALVDLRPAAPVLALDGSFTNLDPGQLGKGANGVVGQEDHSMSGDFSLRLPLLTEPRALFEGLRLSGQLRRIGAQTFDRALAQLDPYERNESIVAQRKLLRHGQLKSVSVKAADGGLSLFGAVAVEGIDMALPRIDRLRLAELPLRKETAQLMTAVATARQALELARADTLKIGAGGEISLLKEAP